MRIARTVSLAIIFDPTAAWIGISKSLPRNLFFELLAHLSSALVGRSLEYDEGQRIHFFFIDEDIEFYKLASLIAEQLVVE